MNGIANHIHMLIDLSVELSVGEFMREFKRSSSIWLSSHPELFPDFKGWSKGYYAFSCGETQQNAIVEYIKNQETHHNIVSYDNEMQAISSENNCEYYSYD